MLDQANQHSQGPLALGIKQLQGADIGRSPGKALFSLKNRVNSNSGCGPCLKFAEQLEMPAFTIGDGGVGLLSSKEVVNAPGPVPFRRIVNSADGSQQAGPAA